jgi:Transposase.
MVVIGFSTSKKVRQQPVTTRAMIIFFFGARGIFHHEFVLQGQTVNQEVYVFILRCIREALRRRHELWPSGRWTLLHDNARPHTALSVSRFLTKHKITVLPHPPYFPDLHAIFLFPKLKKRLKGWRHENIEAIQAAAAVELTAVLKEAFSSCFQDLQIRSQQCIDCGGNYFEGDRKH